MEFIQAVELQVHNGRVVSVNRLVDDWDSELTWDNPALVTAWCYARHFSSGLSDTKALAGFITVESTSNSPMTLKATLRTSSSEPAGRPDRNLEISGAELTLEPVTRRLMALPD